MRPLNVDPTLIPLPPHSPPASTVSFSSRSSASRSTVSTANSKPTYTTLNSHAIGTNPGLGIDLPQSNMPPSQESPRIGYDDEDDGHQVRAEAKSNRKVNMYDINFMQFHLLVAK